MRFIRKNGRVIPIREKGEGRDHKGTVAGVAAATAVAHTQRDRLTGVRSVFHGLRNSFYPWFENRVDSKFGYYDKKPSTEHAQELFKGYVNNRGFKAGEYKESNYFKKVGDRSGRTYQREALAPNKMGNINYDTSKVRGKFKRVMFVADRRTGQFTTGPSLKTEVEIRMGEADFKRKFVKEKSFEALDDAYHRRLDHKWYAKRRDSNFDSGKLRHKLDIRHGVSETAKEIKDSLFPHKFGYQGKRENFISHNWGHKGFTPKVRLGNMKRDLNRVKRSLNPLNTSYEHSYFTDKTIGPRRIVGSPRYVEPKLRLANILANKPRFLAGAALTVGAGIAAKAAYDKISGHVRRGKKQR